MNKGRLEAFSDGVFAILITILVLGLVPPKGTDLSALAALAPVFVAYVLSFLFLAIYWNNHHHMLQAAEQVDGRVLWANLHLLFWLSLLPFVTGWMGENGFPPVPVAAYGVVCFGAGTAYFWLERTLVRLAPVGGPLRTAVGGAVVKERLSLVAYAASAAVAFVLPPLALAGYVGVAASWFIPDPRIERAIGQYGQGRCYGRAALRGGVALARRAARRERHPRSWADSPHPESPHMTADLEPASAGLNVWIERGRLAAEREEGARATARTRRFDTIAVHGVYDHLAAAANQGAIIEPAYLAPAQHFADSDNLEAALGYLMPAWGYTRIANPTSHYLEETLALLEAYGTELTASTVVTGSGMAAVHLATNALLAIDPARPSATPNLVASAKCYGGTFMLFSRYAAERGIGLRWISDPLDAAAWAAAIDDDTRFLYAEVPSNPALAVVDIPALAALAHAHAIPLIIDSTVATPALLRPLSLGADIVIHSLSKAIGSSGLAIAGAVTARRDIPARVGPDDLRADFATHLKLLPARDLGAALSPSSALALLSDLRTVRVRMDAWSRSTMSVARYLSAHPAVETVWYPGLETHPGHAVAARDFSLADGDADGRPATRFGTLLSFTLRDGLPAARRAFDRLGLVFRATDLGRVKSIAAIPSISTHQQQGEAGRAIAAVDAGLIRLSVGGEHPDDVIADLAQALEG